MVYSEESKKNKGLPQPLAGGSLCFFAVAGSDTKKSTGAHDLGLGQD